MEAMTMIATLAGTLAGVGVTMALWWCFGRGENAAEDCLPENGQAHDMKWKGRSGEERRCSKGEWVKLEPEVTEEDVRSFFAKYDPVERNVPVAMIAEWKQMAAEKMAAVHSAEEFAYEQGRLTAYREMEQAFLEMGREGEDGGREGR